MGYAVTGATIPFDDIVGVGGPAGPEIHSGRESRGATRTGIIAWANINTFLAELFPAPPALPGTFPGITYLYANDVTIKPWPPSPAQSAINCTGSFPTYTYAIATVSYDTIKYDSSDLIERRTAFSTEVMLVPSNAIEWSDKPGEGVQQEDLAAAKQIPLRDISFTFHRVPPASITTMRASIDAAIGHVNSATYKGFAAETLLYKGGEESFRIDSGGMVVYTINHGFQARMVKDQGGTVRGWNYFFRNADSAWKKLVYTGTSTGLYPTASAAVFNALFTS